MKYTLQFGKLYRFRFVFSSVCFSYKLIYICFTIRLSTKKNNQPENIYYIVYVCFHSIKYIQKSLLNIKNGSHESIKRKSSKGLSIIIELIRKLLYGFCLFVRSTPILYIFPPAFKYIYLK